MSVFYVSGHNAVFSKILFGLHVTTLTSYMHQYGASNSNAHPASSKQICNSIQMSINFLSPNVKNVEASHTWFSFASDIKLMFVCKTITSINSIDKIMLKKHVFQVSYTKKVLVLIVLCSAFYFVHTLHSIRRITNHTNLMCTTATMYKTI